MRERYKIHQRPIPVIIIELQRPKQMRLYLKIAVFAVMLLGLPMIGIIIAGQPIARYLEFPPESRYVSHARFSWPVFAGYALFTLATLFPLFLGAVFRNSGTRNSPCRHPFPPWGWCGIVSGGLFWILAWTRFSWFAPLQPHTFIPLWLSFIVVANALGKHRTGRCIMTDRPVFFLLLFPVSAAFWWFFEYLNRFVQNWHYSGVEYTPGRYFLYATLSFSTVLPAVLSVQAWLSGSPLTKHRFVGLFPLSPHRPRRLAWVVLTISGVCLMLIGIFPNLLFPLLWISPLLIVVSVQSLLGERHIFSGISRGDWQLVISSSMAALICGFFWEMCNYWSLARWEYSIPFVHKFQVFEMPILGYAGYFPFGLECAAVGMLLSNLLDKHPNDSP